VCVFVIHQMPCADTDRQTGRQTCVGDRVFGTCSEPASNTMVHQQGAFSFVHSLTPHTLSSTHTHGGTWHIDQLSKHLDKIRLCICWKGMCLCVCVRLPACVACCAWMGGYA